MNFKSMFQLVASRKFLAGMLLVVFSFIAAGEAFSLDLVPKRRKKQWSDVPGYLIFPMPYSLPGIGSGMMLTTASANTLGTYTDFYAVVMTGGLSGYVAGVDDIHILKESLVAAVNVQNFSRATVNDYGLRGMSTSGDQYNVLDASDIKTTIYDLRYTLWDRRLEFYGISSSFKATLNEIRDPDGVVIATYATPPTFSSSSTGYGVKLDLTDDATDPRRGLRVNALRTYSPPENADAPDFFTIDLAVTGYIPIGKISTLGIHYAQSDAHVTTPGLVDWAALQAQNDLNCLGDPVCQAIEDGIVQNALNANMNGTSTGLGGQQLLRGYPMGRFSGAHMRYVAAEYRWNLSEGFTPFNYWVWKDVRTAAQLAFFYEKGTVAEYAGDLWKESRSNYGVGFRMVAASGYAYRIDLATGDEGTNPTIIFGYPW